MAMGRCLVRYLTSGATRRDGGDGAHARAHGSAKRGDPDALASLAPPIGLLPAGAGAQEAVNKHLARHDADGLPARPEVRRGGTLERARSGTRGGDVGPVSSGFGLFGEPCTPTGLGGWPPELEICARARHSCLFFQTLVLPFGGCLNSEAPNKWARARRVAKSGAFRHGAQSWCSHVLCRFLL